MKFVKETGYNQDQFMELKANKYNKDLTEIDLAANRGYAKTQYALNRKRQKAIRQNQRAYLKYVNQVLGKEGAAGMTGQSAGRIADRREAMLTTKEAF